MKKIKLIGLSTLIISIVACGQTTQDNAQSDIQNNWKTINETDYIIQYPDSFDLNTSGQMGMSFILLSRQTSQQDNFRENVNLLIQDLKGLNINLDKFVEISVGQIKTMLTNGNLIESKKLRENGVEFQKLIYSGDQGIYKLKFEQFYWVKNEKAYILTLTCEVEQFENYKVTGEKILKSFKLK